MVESPRDTIGPSPILKGRELRKWALCANAGDFVDVWLEAVSSKGRWFTRQAMYGNRLDQARLILQGETRTELRKSYFKMDGGLMQREEVKQEVGNVWGEHPWWATDDRKRWGLALKRTRAVLLKHKNKQGLVDVESEEIYRRLDAVRHQVQDSPTETNRVRFEEELQAARRREQLNVRMSRIKCRIKWLKDGDAASRFFFACLKAKNKREEITSLKLPTGVVVTDEGRILKLIEETYGDLYTAEEESPEVLTRRGEVLQLLDKRLTDNQNRQLEEEPT
ncbi:hypothetical protein R1sor_011672 [Riccia sorocarpa]|uniref:Uncharacterized protein n=1 Tax=Riccia sorocarpa TaxID=122646 RepID=A0ABD3I2L7_9MARC